MILAYTSMLPRAQSYGCDGERRFLVGDFELGTQNSGWVYCMPNNLLRIQLRIQLAQIILVHVLAAQRCASITVLGGERRQVMERFQHTFRRHGRS